MFHVQLVSLILCIINCPYPKHLDLTIKFDENRDFIWGWGAAAYL